jgi:hypothetical protein
MTIKTAITRQCSRLLTVAADFFVEKETDVEYAGGG